MLMYYGSSQTRLFSKGLLEMVKAVNPPGGWKILVIDAVTTRIISSACSMYDIMEEGVSSMSS